MTSTVTLHRLSTDSPRSLARRAGGLQLLEGLTSAFGQMYAFETLVVRGSAAATAANFLAHERLFWLGFASCVAGVGFHLAWALALYDLLKPAQPRLSLFGLLTVAVACAVQAVAAVFYLAPMFILRSSSTLTSFSTDQINALAYLLVRANHAAYTVYLVFFGLWCFLIGLLIVRSTFLPRIIGVLLSISGAGWMVNLFPPLATRLFMPYIATASALGEMSLLLWLLIRGVDEDRWREQASRGM